MDIASFDSSANTDHTLPHGTHLTFDRLYSLFWKCKLYSKVKNRYEQLQFVRESGQLLQQFRNMPCFVVVLLKVNRPSSTRSIVIELDEDEITANQSARKDYSVAPVYFNCSILHFDAKWWSVQRLTQVRTPKWYRSSCSSLMMEDAALNRQRKKDEILCAARPATKEVKL